MEIILKAASVKGGFTMFNHNQQSKTSKIDEAFLVDPIKISKLPPKSVYDYFKTTEKGLVSSEYQTRFARYGANTLKTKKTFHPLKSFLKNFVNLMAIMLWVASILAIVSGTPIISYVIWCIIFINAVFSFIQESKADKALQSLSKMIPNKVKVYRDGKLIVQLAEELVPGDVLFISAGDKVPADLRIVHTEGLSVDNSMLTGESVPVERDDKADTLDKEGIVDRTNLLFAGTTITDGNAKAVVFATGENTQIGTITETTAHIKPRKSTLELQIKKITKILVMVALTIGTISFFISFLVGDFKINAALIFAIGMIVANIPEGLMPTVSLSLALSVQRMAKKKALVRKQSAVETLSSLSVICTDKTGTLTQNSMFANRIWTADGVIEIEGTGYWKKGKISGITNQNELTLNRFFTAASVCSETVLHTDPNNEDKWKLIGNPTEAAILVALHKYGMDVENIRSQFELVKEIPFSSQTKSMTVLARNNRNCYYSNENILNFTKGNPGKVIDRCSYLLKGGKVIEMSAEDKADILAFNDEMASKGYRLLAVAYCEQADDHEVVMEDFILLGLAVMYDPPKEGVSEAVAECYKAGIKVTVVTGDYSLTAAAIAKQIGIIQDDYVAITGQELEQMTSQQLAEKINTDLPVIFARTTPADKLKIVEAYQSIGHVVASTGDGLNDVLALRKADIGISMGENGSDAAIESSDIVLLDDNFVTIVEAVKEGRAINNNIQKFISYILASNIPEILPFLVMGVFDIPLALPILLVLAIDLGTDMLPAISLGTELPDEDVLDHKPRNRNSNILNKKVLLHSYGFLGVIEASMLFVMFFFAWNYFGYTFEDVRSFTYEITSGTASEHIMYVYQYAVTFAFGAVIACQVGNVLVCRSAYLPLYKSMKKKNNLMIWGIVAEVVLFFVIAYVPFFQMLFGTVALKLHHLALLLVCPVVLILLEECRKWILNKYSKKVSTI